MKMRFPCWTFDCPCGAEAHHPLGDCNVAVVAAVISLILPKQYTASVALLPPQQNSSMGSAIASQLGNLGAWRLLPGRSRSKKPNDLYIAMLKSRTVEEAMVRHFGLVQEYKQKYISDACKVFERHATIDGSGKDGLLHIAVEDRDPIVRHNLRMAMSISFATSPSILPSLKPRSAGSFLNSNSNRRRTTLPTQKRR